MPITKKDIVKTWNLTEVCEINSNMTQLEICNAIKGWINSTFPFLNAQIFETKEQNSGTDRSKIIITPGIIESENEKIFGTLWGSQITFNSNDYQTKGTGIQFGLKESDSLTLFLGEKDCQNQAISETQTTTTMGTNLADAVNYPFGVQVTKDNIDSLCFKLIKTKKFYAFNFFRKDYEKFRPGMIICQENDTSDYLVFYDYVKGTSQIGKTYLIRYKDGVLLNPNSSYSYIDTGYRSRRNTIGQKVLTNLAIPKTDIICEDVFIGNGNSFVNDYNPYSLQSDPDTYYMDFSGEPESYLYPSTQYTFKITLGDNKNLYNGFTDEEWNKL